MLLEPNLNHPQLKLSSSCKIAPVLHCSMDKYGQSLQLKYMDNLPNINGTRSSSQAQTAHQELLPRATHLPRIYHLTCSNPVLMPKVF